METDKVSTLWPKGGRDVGKAISVRAAYAFGDWRPVEPPAQRLECLRSHLEAEDISMGELIELADLAEFIDPSDTQLLEAAGVPEQDYRDGNTPKQVAERGYRTFDLAERIMSYEDGTASEEETIELFQYLVDTGQAWTLQGSYGRAARSMIEAGLVMAS